MGSGFDEMGQMAFCDGTDVLKNLNDVFAVPGSPAFLKAAKVKDMFGAITETPGNYVALIKAYDAAGIPVKETDPWGLYLKLLGTARPQGPKNIYDIAQIRYNGLNDGVVMETAVHVPQNGGHVRTVRGTKAGLHSSIDSPCPMPGKAK
jgi:hypothetical protein